MRFGTCIPILRFYDEAKTKDFYLDFLGFKLDWEHRFETNMPLYMQVSYGDCLVHLSEHHGDAAPGSSVRIEIDDIDAYHQAIMAKGYKYMRPGIELMPWGMREMRVIDPAFNRLIFFMANKQA